MGSISNTQIEDVTGLLSTQIKSASLNGMWLAMIRRSRAVVRKICGSVATTQHQRISYNDHVSVEIYLININFRLFGMLSLDNISLGKVGILFSKSLTDYDAANLAQLILFQFIFILYEIQLWLWPFKGVQWGYDYNL